MPAPIEAFQQENQTFHERLKADFLGLLGGSALLLTGATIQNKAVLLAGGVVAMIEGTKMGIDNIIHDQRIHQLNQREH